MAAAQTVGWIRSHGRKATAFALFALVLLTALAFASSSKAAVESPPPPSVWSDKADYAPGELVTLSGANWAPSEAVHIRVNDDAGETWRRDVDVTADESGAISDQFNLPDWFVAQYTVTATGASSGTATWSFTDGNVTLHPAPAADGVTTYRVTYDVWDNTSTDCGATGTALPTAPQNRTLDVTTNTNIPGFGGTSSSALLKSVAVINPASGKTFDKWTSGDNKVDAGTTVSSPACVTNNNGGSGGNLTDLYAHFKNANAAPVCNNGSATTPEDTAVATTLNCTDADGNALTYTIVSGPSKGVLSGTAPNLTYTPNANANGSDSFTFKANDGTVDSNTATFSLTINAVNDAPVANAQSVTTAEDTAKTITLTGSDVDGNNLTFAIDSSPAHGTLGSIGAPTCTGTTPKSCTADVTYTPASNYNGSDSFTFKVNDGTVDSSAATVSITVTAVNDAPTADAQSVTTNEDTAKLITLAGSDVDGNNLSFSIVSGPTHGTLGSIGAPTCTGTTPKSCTADVTYTPASNYNGSDSFTFKVNDGTVDSSAATVSITVTAVNDAPVATVSLNDHSPKTNDTLTATATRADVDGDAVTLRYVWKVNGTVKRDVTKSANSPADLTDTFSLATATNGDKGDLIRVEVTPNDGTVNGATVFDEATVVNSPPTIALDAGNTYTWPESTTAERSFAFSASDPDFDTLTITADCGPGSLVTGSVGASSFKCKFPDGPVAAGSKVSVSANDGDAGIATDEHEITINNVAPTADFTNTGPVDEGSSFTLSMDNGDDVSSVDKAAKFTFAFDCGDGSGYGAFTVTPTLSASTSCSTNDNGTRSVKAKIKDKDGGVREYTASVTVNNVAPKVNLTGAATVDEGGVETYHFTITDPGTADTFSFVTDYPTCGLHGDIVGTPAIGDGSFDCSFPDGPTTTNVAIKVQDDDGGVSTADIEHVEVIEVTVANVTPIVTAASNQSSDEGELKSFSLGSFSDPGTDSPWAVDVNWGDSSTHTTFNETATGAASNQTITAHSHSYADNGLYTVTVTVTDKNGDSDSKTFDVSVNNVAPTVTAASGQSSDEGELKSFSLGSFSDPGSDSPWAVDVDWGDLSAHTTFNETFAGPAASHTITAKSHKYDDNATYTVTVKVTDKDGDFDSKTFQVTVANVPPTGTLGSNTPINEGGSATVSFSAVSDPSVSDSGTLHYAFDCNGGSLDAVTYSTSTATNSKSCSYDDGPSDHTVTGVIIDDDGGRNDDTTSVHVNNVAPSATFNSPASVNEGSSFTLSLTSPSDPSTADAGAGFTYAFDCGSGTYGAFGASNSTSCPTNDNGSRSVGGKIEDKDGGVREYTGSVTVNNVAPTATFSNDGPVAEGSSFTIQLTSPSDPSSADTSAGFTYAFDCGSGYGAYGTATGRSCPTTDNGTRAVKGKIKDKDGGVTEYTGSVTVTNVAPHITSVTASNSFVGPLVFMTSSISTLFTDPGSADTWINYLTFSDGGAETSTTQPTAQGGNSYKFTLTHSFATPGCKTVTSRVNDDDGGFDTFGPTPLNVGTGEFLPPMTNTKVTNKLKNGQVLPVKIKLTDCNGVAITNLSPAIILKEGDLTTGAPDDLIQPITVESVSGADTTGVMRSVDSSYIYNMRVNVAKLNQDYTVIIYPFGLGDTSQSIRHVIQATK